MSDSSHLPGDSGSSAGAASREHASSGRHQPWTSDEVLGQLARAGDYATDVAKSLLTWGEDHLFIETTGGYGKSHGTLRMAADTGRDVFSRVLLLYADPVDGHPSLEIYVKQLISIPPYDRDKPRQRLMADLRSLDIPRLQADGIPSGIWPGIHLDQLSNGRLDRLLSVIDRWIADVRAHASDPETHRR